jgi:signal transduction histidine kinase
MEEELLKSNRLAAIGETAAMVGHDLRNPLQAMLTGLGLLNQLIESTRPEDKNDAVDIVKDLNDQVHYMNKIVSDLQDYSGPVNPEPIEVDLKQMLQDALSTVKCPKNVDTTLVAEDATRVVLDPVLMKRIVVNLVTNAIQAMPDGGRVTVTASKGPGGTSIIVQDAGVGISSQDIDRLFTPFFTKKARGQGLGLVVCKRLAEAQGGTITVSSKLGHGATFTVTVPTRAK